MSKKKKHDENLNEKEQVEEVLEEAVKASEESAQEAEEIEEEKDPLEVAQADLAAQQDKYTRLLAEFDNFKKRTAAEYAKMIQSANKDLMIDIIDVREVFARGLEGEHGDLDSFKEGMQLTYNKLDDNLKKHGLEFFGETGDLFDPALHDAMMKQPHDEIEADHIVSVFEKGYKLKNNIIKHAKVIVSDGPAS